MVHDTYTCDRNMIYRYILYTFFLFDKIMGFFLFQINKRKERGIIKMKRGI